MDKAGALAPLRLGRRARETGVENVTARAQSTRGSRKAGQDSDDELSAGDLDQDDEE